MSRDFMSAPAWRRGRGIGLGPPVLLDLPAGAPVAWCLAGLARF